MVEEKRGLSNQSQAAKDTQGAGLTWHNMATSQMGSYAPADPAYWQLLYLQQAFISSTTVGRGNTMARFSSRPSSGPFEYLTLTVQMETMPVNCSAIHKKNYYNAHFLGLSQGLFNSSEELWRRNSGYCFASHRIWKDGTWILHKRASVTDAAPIDYFPHKTNNNKNQASQKLIYFGPRFSRKYISFRSLIYSK